MGDDGDVVVVGVMTCVDGDVMTCAGVRENENANMEVGDAVLLMSVLNEPVEPRLLLSRVAVMGMLAHIISSASRVRLSL